MSALCAFVSCGDDGAGGKTEIEDRAIMTSYKFRLNLTRKNDHANVLKTTCSYMDDKGRKVTGELDDEAMTSTINEALTNFPDTLTISVTEVVRPEVDRTKNEKYRLCMEYNLSITSYKRSSLTNVISIADAEGYEHTTTRDVSAKELSKIYPRTTKLTYHIKENGEIESWGVTDTIATSEENDTSHDWI